MNNKKENLVLSEHIASSYIHPDNVRVSEKEIDEGLIRSIDAFLWRQDVEHLMFPTNLWQAIKVHLPYWFRKRFPVEVEEIDIRVIYPELSMLPDAMENIDIRKTKKFVVSTSEIKKLPEIVR